MKKNARTFLELNISFSEIIFRLGGWGRLANTFLGVFIKKCPLLHYRVVLKSGHLVRIEYTRLDVLVSDTGGKDDESLAGDCPGTASESSVCTLSGCHAGRRQGSTSMPISSDGSAFTSFSGNGCLPLLMLTDAEEPELRVKNGE